MDQENALRPESKISPPLVEVLMFRILSLVLLLSGATAAQAGLLFEPYAGYAAGTIKVNGASAHPVASVQSLDSKGTIDGMAYGARLGWMFGRFVMGAEYQGIRGSEKIKGVDESVDWNSTAIYGMLGWRFFSGIRLFGAMTVQPYEATEDTSPEPTKFTGESRKIVLGYEYRAPVAINLEYAAVVPGGTSLPACRLGMLSPALTRKCGSAARMASPQVEAAFE